MRKRILIIAAVVILASLAVSYGAAAIPQGKQNLLTQRQVTDALLALKEDFPEGMKWTSSSPDGGAYLWIMPGSIVSMSGCAAFAAILQDTVFGGIKDNPPSWQRVTSDCNTKGMPENEETYRWETVWPGDILQYNGHTVIVVEKFDDYVTVAEGGYGGTVHWGRRYSREAVSAARYLITRYSRKEKLMPYLDLPEKDHWSTRSLTWAVLNDVAFEKSDCRLCPSSDCTRADMVLALWAACGRPEPKSRALPFEDVREGAPCYDAVCWAYGQRITVGTGRTEFSPDAGVTRAQAMTFLWRAMKSPNPSSGKNRFFDVRSSDYFCKAVNWASENGITAGTSPHSFTPNGTCSMAEMYAFLYRIFTAE